MPNLDFETHFVLKMEESARWRDILPLPHVEPFDWGRDASANPPNKNDCSLGCYRRRLRRYDNRSQANNVIDAVNEMAGFQAPKVGAPTLLQQECITHILKTVVELPRSSECMPMREAVRELLQYSPHSPYVEEVGAGTTVRPYQRDLVSLPEVGSEVMNAYDLLDETGKQILEAYDSSMLCSEEERLSKDMVSPYMDTVLQGSNATYVEFVKDLWERGMLEFQSDAAAVVTPFFVIKKSGKLRLVLDCRVSNTFFVPPPDIAMPAGYSFSQIQIGEDQSLFTAQSDIRDYFYSIGMPECLRKYFCLPQVDLRSISPDHPMCAGAQNPVLMFPTMKVVPMGWSWAMYIAQRVHQCQAMTAGGVPIERVLVDGRPAPPLGDDPILVPYADNLNIVGVNKQKVQEMKDKIIAHLHTIGFRTHEEQDAELRAEALGFTIDGVQGKVRPKPNKRERARKVLLWLSTQPKVNGRMLERIIGHCIHFFMVRRELLSIFRAVYDFKSEHYYKRVTLWKSAAQECRWAAALLLMCHADLRRPWHSEVTASDASLSGTGVVSMSKEQVCDLGSQRELWRYRAVDSASRAREHVEKLDPFLHHETVKECPRPAEDMFQLNLNFKEVPQEFLDPSRWTVCFATRMHKPEHITLLEGRAVVQAVRHKTRSLNAFHSRHVHFGDNLGMVLSLDRGRAKSKSLLFQRRRVAAFSIAADVEFHHRWIPSESNAADAPSRVFEKSVKVSKHALQKAKEEILYPGRGEEIKSLRQKATECFQRDRCPQERKQALRWPDKVAQAGRREKADSRIHRVCQRDKEKAVDEQQCKLPKSSRPNFPGAACRITKNSHGLQIPSSSLSSVLSPQQAVFRKSISSGLPSCDLSGAVFQGWHGPGRSNQVFSSSSGSSSRAISSKSTTKIEKSFEGMEESGPRKLKASSGLSHHSAHCSPTMASQTPKCRSLCADHVCDVLPALRTSEVGAQGPDSLHGNGSTVVTGAEQVRESRDIKNGPSGRDHVARQQGAALARRSFEKDAVPRSSTVQPGLPRAEQTLEDRPAKGQSTSRLRRLVSAPPLRSIMGSPSRIPVSAGGEDERKMGGRLVNGKVRKACPCHATIRTARPVLQKKCSSSSGNFEADGPRTLIPTTPPVLRHKVCLELFSGTGRLSNKLCKAGFVVESWDILNSSKCDLLSRKNVNHIIDRIRAGKIAFVHVGLPCSSWSRARRWDGRGPGPLRDDHEFLFGFPCLNAKDRNKVQQGNQLLLNSVRILKECSKFNIPWTLENPKTSRVWLTRHIRQLKKYAQFFQADFCQYQGEWRKSTYFLTHISLSFDFKTCTGPKGFCSRTKCRHSILQGTDSSGRFLTKVAEPYPFGLASHIATRVRNFYLSRR